MVKYRRFGWLAVNRDWETARLRSDANVIVEMTYRVVGRIVKGIEIESLRIEPPGPYLVVVRQRGWRWPTVDIYVGAEPPMRLL